jgi:hypothetical protein
MFFLSLLGVANYRKYLKLGRYFIVVAFIVGAIFTPPEPLSQLLMAVPICVLYYVGVIFGYVAGLIRSSEGESATPTWVTAGVVVLFGASVGLASYLWSTSGARPAVAAALPAEASFAVRAAPATSLGRAVLREASVPEALIAGEEVPDGVVLAGMGKGGTWFAVGADFPCEGGRTVAAGLCLVRGEWLEGTGVAGGGHLLDVLDSESVPVALVVPAGCAGIVSGGAAGEGVALVVEANAQPGGMASVVIRPSGAETGVEAFLGWWKRETARLGPGAAMASEAPLARMLAWAGPDSEEGKDGRSIVLSVSPPRAGRMLGEFVNALAERCR